MFEIAFQIAGKLNSSFGGAFNSAENRLQRLNQQVISLNADMRELEKAQKAGKITAEEYTAAYAKLSAQLQKASSKLSDQIQRTEKAAKIQEKISTFRDKMRSNMLGAVETAVALGAPVKAAIEFESVMADVRKVVDFDTPEQFKAMGKDILTLSTRIPMAANGLAQIVAAGGQAGIARDELINFAESAAKMGVAFDITAEEAGQIMAEWRSAFKMNQEEVNKLADQINYLGNTTAASAPKISEVVRRIGPLGKVGGAAAGEIAALGATMVSAGISEEVAATGIKNLILGMVAGEGATKSQAAAFEELGLNAKSMAKMMQKDAKGAILKVLQALQKLPEYKRAAVLQDLFGKESIGAIAPLLTNLDALEENFKKVGDATQYAGSMQKEFEARSDTTENSLILLKNRTAALGVSLGDILLPNLNKLADIVGKGVDWVQKLSEKYPGLTGSIVTGTAAVLGFSIAFTGLGYVASIILSPFAKFYAWATKIELGTKLAAAAQWLWNAALSANPITLVVVALAGLALGLYILYQRSEKARKVMNALWDGLKNGAASAINWVVDQLNFLIIKLNALIDKINKIPGVNIKHISLIRRVNFGQKEDMFDMGTTNLNMTMRKIQGHAAGGIFTEPHIAWFAEKGPEAVVPLDRSARAKSIWMRAGEALGISFSGGPNITYAPVYNIYGSNEVEQQVRRAAKSAEEDFEKRFKAYLRQERRLSYA